FKAWVESNDRTGWKSEFARENHRSSSWVTRQLGLLEIRLWEQYDIIDMQAFVIALRHIGFGPPVDTSESPIPSEADHPPQADSPEEAFFQTHLSEALRVHERATERWYPFLELHKRADSWDEV